ASDDPDFAADVVRGEAVDLFGRVQKAWSARDRAALEAMCGKDLLVEWNRRLDDFDRKGWHNVVELHGDPQVFYVGMTNREADAEDRVVVLVEARVLDVVKDANGNEIQKQGESASVTTLQEYWTLAKRDGRWTLLSIEQLAEGDHNLKDAVVASPWADDRLRDQALVEGATAEAAPAGTDIAGLVDLDYAGDARKAALDLSLVDPRFGPDILEVAARRAVAGWAEAVDGPDAPLDAVATKDAVAELLYPRGGTSARLVVRGPTLERMTLVALDADAKPPAMTVELALSGRRYIENRDTAAVLEGSRDAQARWTERWTFGLFDDSDTPWRVVSGAGPAESGHSA
ncbi:MAG TPA: TIM44-like domain-containing protein, partial [Solirubrobacteraceae bacterium]